MALHQLKDRALQSLAFFSRQLTSTETRYATYDRELFGIYAAVKHLRNQIEGRTFTIYTDHKPLGTAFEKHSPNETPRHSRQLDFISQFSTDIRYVQGPENIPADVLSRTAAVAVPASIPYQQIAEAQDQDETLRWQNFARI